MIGYGTYDQPPGTWSDDSSLTLCLAESLIGGYDLADMASKFYDWKTKSYWTARNELFDIGITTSSAIMRLKSILDAEDYAALKKQKDLGDEFENGNGSLMRIMPLLFYIKGKDIQEQFDIIFEVSVLTHRHIRAAMCCLIYLKLAEYLLAGEEKAAAYEKMRTDIEAFWEETNFSQSERLHFQRIIQNDIRNVKRGDLKSGGYVMESIEASIWCFLEKEDYEKAILASINLGHDTDTTAAITGGLAGLYYGAENIPEFWRASLARYEDIVDLGERLDGVL